MQIYTQGELVRLVKAQTWIILIGALGLVAGLATYGYNVGGCVSLVCIAALMPHTLAIPGTNVVRSTTAIQCLCGG
jgi:phosphate/sulfate permease